MRINLPLRSMVTSIQNPEKSTLLQSLLTKESMRIDSSTSNFCQEYTLLGAI